MQFWLNKHSEKNNVVIQYKNGLILGSCDRKSYGDVIQKLQDNANPIEIFGKENLSLIPWASIQSITSESNNLDIVLSYKVKQLETTVLSFSHAHNKEKCLANIVALLEEKLEKSTDQESQLSVYLSPAIGILLAIVATILFYQIVPKVSLIVGGLWLVLGFFRLKQAAKQINQITCWQRIKKSSKTPTIMIDNDSDHQFDIRTLFPQMGLAVVIFTTYFGLTYLFPEYVTTKPVEVSKTEVPDQSITRSDEGMGPLIAAINNDEQKKVLSLIRKGEGLDERHDGKTALDFAIEDSFDKAAHKLLLNDAPSADHASLLTRATEKGLGLTTLKKIVSNGVDVNYVDASGYTALAIAMENDAAYTLIKFLLERGASQDILVDGLSPLEFAKNNEDKKLISLLSRY